MKQKDYPAKFSPLAAAYYEWSISFFRDHDITLVGYSTIPDSIVSEWMTDDPQQLLSDMADGKPTRTARCRSPSIRPPTVITIRYTPRS